MNKKKKKGIMDHGVDGMRKHVFLKLTNYLSVEFSKCSSKI